MAEVPLAVASAVVLPDADEQYRSPPATLKRRQSSFSDDGAKRPRLSHEGSTSRPDIITPPQSAISNQQFERRRSGQLEERKRGQRLFGALLGTLSQSSSSTAQKRRSDIEQKQQAKLKLQAEEQDEKKKQKLEALMVIRRREQKKYDKQSMQIRHSNMLAQAHFLQTSSEPKLFYKPWELLPGDEDKIKGQVKEAEDIINQELSQWNAENSIPNDKSSEGTAVLPPEKVTDGDAQMDAVGKKTDKEQPSEPNDSNDSNTDAPATKGEGKRAEPQDNSKDHGDDGGEVVEGEEDIVIY